MGRLVVTSFVTLDGVHQAPGAPDEDTSDGFRQGGWTVPFVEEEFGGFAADSFTRAGAFLLGRRTYDIFAAYWPKVTDPAHPIAGPLNKLPKYVVSGTLTDPDWSPTTVLTGELVEEVAAVKERTEGELQVHGSAALARSLFALDLVDALHLVTFPVVLGAGRRLFGEGFLPTAFRRTGGSVTGTGVSIQTYAPAGRPEYGAFDLPEDA